MRTILILIAFACCADAACQAQHALKGIVKDSLSGKLLPNVTIFVPDLNRGAVTDTSGSFSIRNVPEGDFLIQLNRAGYASLIKKVSIRGNTAFGFALKESVTELEQVVVTGVPASTSSRHNPIPTAVIHKEMLLQNASTNIVDAISKQPGLSQIGTGVAISKPVIRGLSYNRIISLYNGVRQEGQQWGDEHGLELDEYSIERVEVIKGPGSLMYGSDGMGGVVNFITPKPLPEGEVRGSISTNFQSNNHLLGYSLMNTGNVRKIEWLARLSSKHAGNYTNAADGRVYNSGFNEFDYNGHIGTSGKRGFSQLHFSSFSQHVAMPEGQREAQGKFTREVAVDDTSTSVETVTSNDLKGYALQVPQQYIRHQRLFWLSTLLFSRSSLRFALGYQLSRRQEFGEVLHPDRYGLFFYLPTYNYDIKYFLPEFKGWAMSLGLSGMFQQNRNKGTEFLIPEYRLFDIGGFVYMKKSFGKLHISGGVRGDQRSLNATGLYLDKAGQPANAQDPFADKKFSAFSNVYRNASGSMGAIYDISERANLKFNLARGFRAPNMAELASNGRHEGSFRYEYGNAQLKSETSFQADAGISLQSPHVSLEASVFSNSIQHYIYTKRLQSTSGGDSIADATESVPAYQYGQNNALLQGGELTLDIHPHPVDWLHFENSFSMVAATNRNKQAPSKYLPFIPAPRYLGRWRADLKKTGKRIRNFYLLFEVDHYFTQNRFLKENNSETKTPSYTLLNFGLGGNVIDKEGKEVCSLYFSANNLFDISYQNHLSRLKYAPQNQATGAAGIFGMGRNFSIKIIVPYNLNVTGKRLNN